MSVPDQDPPLGTDTVPTNTVNNPPLVVNAAMLEIGRVATFVPVPVSYAGGQVTVHYPTAETMPISEYYRRFRP